MSRLKSSPSRSSALLASALCLLLGLGLGLSYSSLTKPTPTAIKQTHEQERAKALARWTAFELRDKATKAQSDAEATPGPGGVNLPSSILTPKE